MLKKLLIPVFGLLFLPQFVFAGTYDIDPSHSYIGFSVKHMVISNVKGKFNKYSGSFLLDGRDNINDASLYIETASIDTDNEKRDKHLRSADFFDVKKFPKLIFKYKSTKSHEGTHYKILGDLTLHGVTKEVILYMELLGKVKDPKGNFRVGFTGKTDISRKDFGIVWNKILETGGFVVGDLIKISLEIEAILK